MPLRDLFLKNNNNNLSNLGKDYCCVSVDMYSSSELSRVEGEWFPEGLKTTDIHISDYPVKPWDDIDFVCGDDVAVNLESDDSHYGCDNEVTNDAKPASFDIASSVQAAELDSDTSPKDKATVSFYVSEQHRNYIYDSWLDACEKWLYEVSWRISGDAESALMKTLFYAEGISSEHFDPMKYTGKNGACLDDAYEGCTRMSGDSLEEEKHYCETLSDDITISKETCKENFEDNSLEQKNSVSLTAVNFDVWEEWYRIERLNLHKSLYEDGLLNWYEEILCNEEKRFMEGGSMCKSLLEAEALHDELCRLFRPEVSLGG